LSRKIILIAGPTASGKSKLAIQIAKKIKGEIINTDSMQVYKEFSILSSRPSKIDIRKIEHHLYGFQSVKKHFSTGAWLKLVKKQINQCLKNKKIPILVGGTGLYFEAITKGMSKIPNIDFKKRDKIRELQKKIGQRKFYELLLKLDPLVKNKIEPSDTQRSIRAYEVKKFTKKSIYEWYKLTKSEFKKFQIFKIFIDVPREKLLKNISNRAEQMFRNDCVKEVKYFLDLNIDSSLPANKIIGVKEIKDLLSGALGLPQVKEAINIKTRQYAKRQVTWARGHMSDWNKLYSNSFSSLLKKILKVIS
jgi:tRNA dimethylallyltransferase